MTKFGDILDRILWCSVKWKLWKILQY